MRLLSINTKQVVALTGLMLVGFLVAHLSGNLLLLKGPEAFNGYAEKLQSYRPAFYVVEFGLLGVFLVHIGATMRLILESIKARKDRYKVHQYKGSAGFAVRTMTYSGLLVMIYTGIHVWMFTLSEHHGEASVVNGENLALYGLVYNAFHEGWGWTLFYTFSLVVLGLHLDHAVQSSIKTFGFNRPSVTPKIQVASRIFAIIIAGGFITIPWYIKLFDPMGAGTP